MKQEKVSFRQLMALLWAGLLGPAAEWLPSGGLSQGLMDSFGPGAGRAVLTIYIIWMELLLALRLRLSAQRMMAAG